MTRGFPLKETDLLGRGPWCEHGAGVGAICEKCAGPANFPLLLAAGVQVVVDGLMEKLEAGKEVDQETLEGAVRIRDSVVGWATDRRICFRALGPCACHRCVQDAPENGGEDGKDT